MEYVNLTPHTVNLNDGRAFPPSGNLARVAVHFFEFKNDITEQVFGSVIGAPSEKYGVMYIVSGIVLAASNRKDFVAPATGHPQVIRNDKGQIISVPGFVKKS